MKRKNEGSWGQNAALSKRGHVVPEKEDWVERPALGRGAVARRRWLKMSPGIVAIWTRQRS